MPDVIGRRVAVALEAALARARVADGARTDIGARVLVNRAAVQGEEAPAVAIRLGEAHLLSTLPGGAGCVLGGQWSRDAVIEGVVRPGSDALAAEDVAADIVAAVSRAWADALGQDRAVTGIELRSFDTTPRDDGNDVVGASVTLAVAFAAPGHLLE